MPEAGVAPVPSGRLWPVAEPASPAPAVRAVVTANPHHLPPDLLFGVARRRNPKRSALFVSKVLAKHVPVHPSTAVLAGLLLGRDVAAVLGATPSGASDPVGAADALADPRAARQAVAHLRASAGAPSEVLVLGFAETATSLGHLVRDALGSQARGLLTTRLHEEGYPPLARFEEEHSHATAHRIVHDDVGVLSSGAPLVLVDDELTTGRTVLNTIAALHDRAPRERYVVAGLLDWRGEEAEDAFAAAAARLGVRIDVVSLVRGRVEGDIVDDRPIPPEASAEAPRDAAPPIGGPRRHTVGLVRAGARHGWDAPHQAALEARLPELAGTIGAACGGDRILCLGTEELMYLPIRLAELLGEGARVQTTTRSPAIAADVGGYPLRHRRVFEHPGDPGRPSYVYNVAPGAYDDVVVLVDPGARGAGGGPPDDAALVAGLAGSGARLHVVHLEEER